MTIAILTILASLVPFVIELIRQHLTAEDDPQNELLKANEKVDMAIVQHDAVGVSVQLNDALQRLQNRS